MDNTTAFISAALKPVEFIYFYPPRGVDIGLGSNGLPRVLKLNAPLEGTRPAVMNWTQTSKIPIKSFGFVPIDSGGAFRMYNHPPDFTLLCTQAHIDDFLLAASGLILAEHFHDHYRLYHKRKFGVAITFVSFDIIRDRSIRRIYLF